MWAVEVELSDCSAAQEPCADQSDSCMADVVFFLCIRFETEAWVGKAC